MKFSLSWLRDHLDFTASLDELCAALNRIGLEVEAIDDPTKRLSGFRTAKILEAVKHPDADRLQVCKVNAGPGMEELQVVCGAPNARTGLHVIFAPPGTYIPGSDITIKAGKIRGQKSEGMLCSLRELGLGEESDGIAELSSLAPVGEDYVYYAKLDDPVIEIAITPNRGDALSVRGIARDLAAAGVGHLKPWLTEAIESKISTPFNWKLSHSACSFVMGRVIRGVKNGPSPEWLKRRLDSVGVKSHSALVDITNYVMYDIGRPLHVFDAAKLSGSELNITHAACESFKALDGKDYVLGTEDMIIADNKGVQSLAGIIGGEASSVDENSTDIFVESGYFDAVQIALTGRRLGINSDARYRFERGVDPALVRNGLEAASALIISLCGGEAGEVVEAGKEPAWQRTATLRFEKLKTLAGMDIASHEAVTSLEHLGFEVREQNDEKATFAVPSWRHDIASAQPLSQAPTLTKEQAEKASLHVNEIEAECDLIEEVLRLKGIDTVAPQSLPPLNERTVFSQQTQQARHSMLRRLCAARGYMETVGFSFVSDQDASYFDEICESEKILNPIASDLNQLRPTPLINLLRALDRNLARGLGQNGEAAFFEIGPSFGKQGSRYVLSAVRGGVSARAPGKVAQEPDWLTAKADLLAALELWGVPDVSLTTTSDAPKYYHPGRSGVVRQGPKLVLGSFGELHPTVARHFGLTGTIAVFELNIGNVPMPKNKRKAAPDLSPLQPVRRDFAFLSPKEVDVQDLIKAARMADRKLVTDVRLFDIYEGDKLPEGYRSIGIEVTLQPKQESLTDQQLEALAANIERAVQKVTGAVLRR
ncbi:phenylalanine--tRNA ligase subunit beta [Aristophania vespae]|uniref:Phenylalanine--tRNA ligase beta subunit n=1 Tax=Aristophania vespae TaxID=2697033 RepID=A0A6P1NH09_9PROT|nr:phenylalanine--tRNA ligase subunit beta [Aristophania vespae]QHI95810.1 phenylalanine--tRNA ligase subunit beta [Aristophania vespae]